MRECTAGACKGAARIGRLLWQNCKFNILLHLQ
nr:MAG TPA: hypothetical protein [Caudoviricetes sp.]